jgi:hypothetical protein
VEEELLGHSPAAHVRRPRLDYESHATALDRNELGALLVAAGLGVPAEHALISLLALNGLRASEVTGANVEALSVERGHRTLVITRKGAKVVTIPLAPRTARAIDLAVGERSEGPVFLAADDRRLDRHGAADEPGAPWHGVPDALPAGQYQTGRIDFNPAAPRPYSGRTLELRYGPADIPVMEPHLRAYALVNGRRIAPTAAVQVELFGG